MSEAQTRRLERLLAVAEHPGTGAQERETAMRGARKVAASAGLTDRYARRFGLAAPDTDALRQPADFDFDDMVAAMRTAAEAARRMAADVERAAAAFPVYARYTEQGTFSKSRTSFFAPTYATR